MANPNDPNSQVASAATQAQNQFGIDQANAIRNATSGLAPGSTAMQPVAPTNNPPAQSAAQGAPGAPQPSAPGWAPGQDPNAVNRQQYGSGVNMNPGLGIGTEQTSGSPITIGQQASAFVDPYAAQNMAAIGQGYNNLLGGYQAGGSSLAGLTHLGAVTNANAAQIDQSQSNPLIQGQVSNINALNAQAQGQGPSVAEQQAKQLSEQNIAANMATIGSQRGSSNSALGLRAAQDAKAQANQQAVQAGALGRSQEALAARQQLTGALGGTTGQVQQGAQAQAALQQQPMLQNAQAANAAALQQGQLDQGTALANLQAQLAAGQINQAQYNAMLQAQMTQGTNDFGAAQNYVQMITGENTNEQALAQKQNIANTANSMGLQSAGIAGASTAVAGALSGIGKSDRRAKKDIRGASRDINDFLSQISHSASAGGFALLGAKP